jgi:hypothetical protein
MRIKMRLVLAYIMLFLAIIFSTSSTQYINTYTSNLSLGNSNQIFIDNTNGRVGIGTTSPTNILSLGGNSVRTIGMERHTTSNTAGNDLTIQAGGATLVATDKAGGNLILESGNSTGTGASEIQFWTSTATTTGNITAIELYSGGSSYTLGDNLSVNGGYGDAYVNVTAVDGGGGVTAVALTNGGTGGYSVGTDIGTWYGGGGSGCTISITSITAGTADNTLTNWMTLDGSGSLKILKPSLGWGEVFNTLYLGRDSDFRGLLSFYYGAPNRLSLGYDSNKNILNVFSSGQVSIGNPGFLQGKLHVDDTDNNAAIYAISSNGYGVQASGYTYDFYGSSGNPSYFTGEVYAGGVASDGEGKAVCVKSDGNLGTCTTAVNATGYCTCS